MPKTPVPAVAGWFTTDAAGPRLLGSRCRACGSLAFPKQSAFCSNPACDSTELDEVPLSARGRLWSWSNNCYAPPPPYPAADPFVPYAIAAVELEAEKMVVLGQVDGVGADALEPGMEMELSVGPLYSDEEHQYLIWKWRPVRL
jgi:uncharacterized OB-fold protein